MQRVIHFPKFSVSNHSPFFLIAGPCQVESVDHCLMIADQVSEICNKHDIGYVFKSSFDKANRTSVHSKRGVPIEVSFEAFRAVKEKIGCPIITDVHSEQMCDMVAEHVDILQIPAFLCRQTDLLAAAAKTKKVINVKKGQFLAPGDAKNIVEKIDHFGNSNIMLTERGYTFGYGNLISDMRSLKIMSETGCPVIFDATHSVQEPGGLGSASGGQRGFIPVLARSAIASCPIAGVFTEVHQDPDNAPSDGKCMLELKNLEKLIIQLKQIDDVVKKDING